MHSDSLQGEFTQVLPITDSSYKRNMYVTNYLDLPFEIRFRSKPNSRGHSWKFSGGMRVGLRLGSHTKTVTSKGKYADYIQPNLTKTRVGLTGRAGYGRVGLYYYYSLTRLFEPGRGHELIPFEVGFTVAPF
ncbi:MAG: PorT family protein [Flavobacteriales bacterium]|nr:PorT family protein [Flavobacteriales bacterium]